MSIVRRQTAAALALALSLGTSLAAIGPSPAGAGSAGGNWTRISGQTQTSINEVATVRTPDGNLHAFWTRLDTAADNKTDLLQAIISPTGATLAKTTVENDWSGISDPDVVPTADGGMRLFFGGIRTGAGDPNQNLNTSVSDQAGQTWTLQSGTVAEADAAYAAEMGAATALDGTPFVSWGAANLHRGLNPADPNYHYMKTVSDLCCGYEPDIGVDGVTGQMFVAWASNATDAGGIWAHEVNVASGAPVGSPMLMPDVLKNFNGTDSYIQELSRVPITGRVGAPGVYIAYHGGYPVPNKLVLWKVGAANATVLKKGGDNTRFERVGLAPASDGRLWLFYVLDHNDKPRIWARRSNQTVTQWGATSWISTPSTTTQAWQLAGNAQDDRLDVIALLQRDGGTAHYHTQILPGLSIIASPTSFTGKHEVKFTVLDAGDPVAGAKVSVGGKEKLTNADGIAKITLGPYDNKKTLTAKATKNNYQSNTVNVVAKP